MTNRISVIINAYNEEKMLAECLASLNRQTRRPDELIVVENGSTDRTVEIARSAGATVHSIPRGTRGEAREFGWRHANGNWIVYGDADDVFSDNWLEEIEKTFESGADCVMDRLQVHRPDNFFTRTLDAYHSFRAAHFKHDLAWGFRRDVLEHVGGFKPGWLEEAELAVRIRNAGFLVRSTPRAIRYHRGKPRDFSDIVQRAFFFGKHEMNDIFRPHPEKFAWGKMGAFGIGVLILLGFSAVGLPMAGIGLALALPFAGSLARLSMQKGSGEIDFRYRLGIALIGVITFWMWPLGVIAGVFEKPNAG